MSSPKAPPAPDPKETSAAQAGMNIDTAIAQNLVNATNQVTPDGMRTYTQSSTPFTWTDSQGNQRSINPLVATETLTPEAAARRAVNEQTEMNLATIGRDQSAKIGGLLGTNFKLGNEQTEGRLFDLGSRRLNPMFARDEEALRTRLSNQGLTAGSEAWNNEMGQFGERRNDAYNQLLLTGRGQANQELLTERNQPINEISALLSGSQVSMPQFSATPTAGVGGVDYAGMVQNQYQAQLQQAQQKAASRNALWGNALQAAGTVAGAAMRFSDRRVKDNIRKIGKADNGLPIYSYTYKGDTAPQIGFMAQDVQKKRPDAVKSFGGILAVDYEKAAS